MSVSKGNSDKVSGNGGNTAVFILSSKGNSAADEDLRQLAEICHRSNNPLTLCASPRLKSSILEDLQRESKIRICENFQCGDDIKNVLPLHLPLANDADVISRWAQQANKFFKGGNFVAAHGRPNNKTGLGVRYFSYWANFWPKLFTGGNANLSACEAVMMPVADFHELCGDKNIKDAWQLSALAEKAGVCTRVPFDYRAGDFVFGDGIRALAKGIGQGLLTLFLSFIKSAHPSSAIKKDAGWKKAFGISAVALLLTMCLISFDYNITWDEPNHNTFSKDVLKYYTSLGSDTTMFDFQKAGHRDYYTNVFYGMSVDVFSAAINSLIGAENDYHVRHLVNAITGFLCILFAALTVRLFGGWMSALLTLLAMACSPSFFGHSFNNPKDIPFAAGYIMAIYYLLKMMREMPSPGHQTKVMLALAIGFALSIRAGGLLLFGILGLALGLHWLFFRSKKAGFTQSVKPYLTTLLITGIAGYCIGIAMWPYALRDPLTGAVTALKEFEKFSYLTYYELFEGVRLFNKPWYYEPKLIFLTAPPAITAGFLLSMLLMWRKQSAATRSMLFMLLFATVFPAFWAIYKKSYVYNGWRHFIFIYPSLAALAVIGWNAVSGFLKGKAAYAVPALVALTLLKPGIWSILNHPYQYMYFNEFAGGVKGASGNYELDYWNQSPREAFEWLVKNKPEILKGELKVSSNNIQESLKTFVPEGSNVKYAWTREYEWADNNWDYAIWTSRTLSKNQILGGYWPPKGTIHEVKVDGVTVAAVVEAQHQYGYQGKMYLKQNKPDSAIYFYGKGLQWNPLEEEYARGLANACRMAMKLDSAEMFYRKALELRDGNYEAYLNLGEISYARSMMQNPEKPDPAILDKAFQYLELAYKHKKNVAAPLYMGEIRLNQNRAEEAASYYNMFIQTHGNVGRGYLGLGRAQLLLGMRDSAYYNLQVAIQLDPKNPDAYYILGSDLQQNGRAGEAEQFLNEYRKLTGSGAN